ncbi:hypothetical protein TRAPUB_7861 [Trametes pubescens]|uniref:BTB domain-containing protein n=1 Tax=Trametes pubescens TaxID=154538 RepID=A0A1M2W6Q9_TRAPU|nr:hypothetical protein TRAPUB_7861 [Trametes pubescens]
MPDPGLWLPDGTACIVAGGRGFRVRKDLLSQLSLPFRVYIFERRDRSGITVEFQGVPCYWVPDSADDMATLLRAIYDGRKYLMKQAPHIRFSVLSALMRLGREYALQDIVDDAADYLEDYFTPDFQTFLQRSNGTHTEKFRLSERDKAAGAAFEAVNLARLTRKHTLLPLALYHACQHAPHEILLGITRTSGAVVSLSRDDMVRCISARRGLLRASSRLAHVVHRAECAVGCAEPDMCAVYMARLRAAFEELRVDLWTVDALAGLETQLGALADLPCWLELCEECREEMVRRHRGTLRETWGKLLDILGLSAEELEIEWETQGKAVDVVSQ